MAVTAEEIRLRVLINGEVQDMPLDKFRGKLNGLDKDAGNLGKSFAGLGPIIAGAFTVTAAVSFVSALKDMADEAARFEKGVKEIGTLMGGMSPEQVKAMSAELSKLSVESGQAIDKLTKARYDIVSAGFSEAAESLQVLNASAKLAIAGVTDVSVGADLLTTALNSYRLEASDATDVSNDLFTIVRNGKTTMTELGANMGALIATAGPLNVSLDEIGAALSTLTANGQSTAMASTAVSASILELSKPSKELTDALASLGIQTDNLIVSGQGYAGALNLVKKASQETGIPINQLISREEALRAIMSLTSMASQKFNDDLASMKENVGAVDKAFDQMSESSALLKDEAVEAFNAAKRSIGDAIIESDLYKESLKDIKGLFEGIAGLSTSTSNSVIDDASRMETSFRNLGTAIRNAFSWAGKVWDLAGQGDGLIEKWESNSAWSRLNREIDARERERLLKHPVYDQEKLKKAAEGSPGMSVGDETAFQRSLFANAQAEIALEDARNKNNPNPHSTVSGSKKGSDDLLKAQQELAREIEDATTWYGKFTESIKGEYDANKEFSESYAKLTLLRNQQINSAGDTIISEQEYRAALEKLGMKYHEALMSSDMSIDNSVWNLGPYASSGNASSEEYSKKVDKTTNAIYDLGYQLDSSGINIKGWDSFAKSYESLAEYFSPSNQSLGDEKNYNALYKGIGLAVSGIGSAIGGSVGDAISSIAGLASSGASIGSMIPGVGTVAGAVVGGVVGLVSSIFGGGDDEEAAARRSDLRQQVYDQMVQSALSGGTYSRQILSDVGWDYDALKNYRGAGAIAGETAGTRFLDDRGESNLQRLSDYLAVMDKAGQTIQQFATPVLLRDLESANALLDYTVALTGDLADVTSAYWDSLIMTVTGISADSIGDMIGNSLSIATSADQAGRLFAETFEAQVVASIKSMAISQAVNDAIMPYLQPVMQQLVAGMIGGTMTASEMAALVEQAKSIAANVVPAVSALYSVFADAGISSYAYSGQTDARSPVTMEARASGGPVYAGKQYKVNESRREVFVPFVDGTILPSTSALGNSEIAAVLKELAQMLRQGTQALLTIDGEQFNAYMERRRLKSEARIAVSGNRLAKQVY